MSTYFRVTCPDEKSVKMKLLTLHKSIYSQGYFRKLIDISPTMRLMQFYPRYNNGGLDMDKLKEEIPDRLELKSVDLERIVREL